MGGTDQGLATRQHLNSVFTEEWICQEYKGGVILHTLRTCTNAQSCLIHSRLSISLGPMYHLHLFGANKRELKIQT